MLNRDMAVVRRVERHTKSQLELMLAAVVSLVSYFVDGHDQVNLVHTHDLVDQFDEIDHW
jgi:hypothetical protein